MALVATQRGKCLGRWFKMGMQSRSGPSPRLWVDSWAGMSLGLAPRLNLGDIYLNCQGRGCLSVQIKERRGGECEAAWGLLAKGSHMEKTEPSSRETETMP